VSASVTTNVATTKPGLGARTTWLLADTLVIARRNLMRFIRIPALFVFSIVQPLMFVLLFRFVFAGAIQGLPPGVSYVNYLLPGIFVQTAIFGSTQTGIGLAEDLASGILDRFRSLPMARSAVLTGRTAADLVRNVVVVVLMIAVGYLVGFSFQAGLVDAIAAVALTVLIGFTFSWISASIGLAIKEVESVQAASFTWIFPLTFISTVFVPLQSMGPFLQDIARNNPVTLWANTVRVLTIGNPALVALPGQETLGGLLLKSFLWIVGLLVIFVPVSVRQYRKID
jgi:ABC-2 type transport system permease protein/oleandomycin transport system permease protein